MSSSIQFHFLSKEKVKIKQDDTDIIRDNIAMYNVYILVSYVEATLFINSVSMLSLVAAIIFSQLGK